MCICMSHRNFKCMRGLKQHMHMVHRLGVVSMKTSKPRVICCECGSIFPNQRKLDEHLQQSHGVRGPELLTAHVNERDNGQSSSVADSKSNQHQAMSADALPRKSLGKSGKQEDNVEGLFATSGLCQDPLQQHFMKPLPETGPPPNRELPTTRTSSEQVRNCRSSNNCMPQPHSPADFQRHGEQGREVVSTVPASQPGGLGYGSKVVIGNSQEPHVAPLVRVAPLQQNPECILLPGSTGQSQCSVCGIAFCTASEYTQHLQWFIPQDRRVLCTVCGRIFSDERALEQHSGSSACKSMQGALPQGT
jgi:uncharacterized C2H2 Zn-finger protein